MVYIIYSFLFNSEVKRIRSRISTRYQYSTCTCTPDIPSFIKADVLILDLMPATCSPLCCITSFLFSSGLRDGPGFSGWAWPKHLVYHLYHK